MGAGAPMALSKIQATLAQCLVVFPQPAGLVRDARTHNIHEIFDGGLWGVLRWGPRAEFSLILQVEELAGASSDI